MKKQHHAQTLILTIILFTLSSSITASAEVNIDWSQLLDPIGNMFNGQGECSNFTSTETIYITNETDPPCCGYISVGEDYSLDATINLRHNQSEITYVKLYNKTLYGTYGGWITLTATNYTTTETSVSISHTLLNQNTTKAETQYTYIHCTQSIIGDDMLFGLFIFMILFILTLMFGLGMLVGSVVIIPSLFAVFQYIPDLRIIVAIICGLVFGLGLHRLVRR